MPVIKIIDGVKLVFKTREDIRHIPHIHLEYNGEKCSISLYDGSILAGRVFKDKDFKPIIKWILENKTQLLDMYTNKNFYKL